jgi:hypothetical protein
MKKIFLSCLLATAALSLTAQKTFNDPNAEVRSVKAFHAIKVSGGIDLYLSSGDEALAVSAKDAETASHIKTEVENGILKIWYDWKDGKGFKISNNKQLKAYVSYKTLDALSGSGGSDIIVDGTIQSNSLSLNISGGSDFNGKVSVKDLRVDASGGSDVDISGKATNVVVDASGGSDFNGFELITDAASVEASGGCDVEITVNKDLNANASGGSDVRYKGSASVNKTSSSGSSSVKKVGK